ncbi:MAG: UDP-N-acetylmuramate dehydrogenase [Candidatus Nanopelagicaceae bacterium]
MTANDLSTFTTLGVGGPATNILHVTSEAQLIESVIAADNAKVPLLILGGGSNVLISDSGFAGTVIRVETTGNSFEIDACSGGTLTVSAGSDWDDFVAFTIEKGLANLESLSGIPGTVGGAPIQNIGAYGHEVSEVIARVRTFDREKQEVKTFMASECGFSYRNSIFKETSGRYVILDVTFQLRRGEESLPIGYAELAKELGVEIGARVPIIKVREAVLKLRGAKGMLVGQGINSAGSFFMNPILEKSVADNLPIDAPRWPTSDGKVKTSAAWLMENAGVSKGDRLAGAQISPKHVLALSNSGDATAQDLLELARSAQEKVRAKFGITLQSEVQLVGLKL